MLKEIEKLRADYLQKCREWEKERYKEETTIERRRELKKESKEETEKYEKAIKEKILNDLPNWALNPEGFFYRIIGELKFAWNCNENKFASYLYLNKNYRNEIVNAFINEIKQNPQDWKIEEEDNAICSKTDWGGCFVVKHKSGRKHYRPFPRGYKNGHNLFGSFSDEEWAEIENALNYNTISIIRKWYPL